MTQPEHPFTDLPEVRFVECYSDDLFRIFLRNIDGARFYIRREHKQWIAIPDCEPRGVAPTPNEAFQALRAAVREMANDLGVW